MKGAISAIIITRDAERHIGDCLSSVSWCREAVVVDSGSSDRTLEIARQFTDKVFSEEWKGYGPQKQSALKKATSEWVLSVDADERVPEELAEEIRLTVEAGGPEDGYYIPRKNFFGDKWLRHGGQYPDYVLRLFRRSAGRFSPDIVHERVMVDGKVGRLRNPLVHYTFEDISSRIRKMDAYSTLSARQLHEAGRRTWPLAPLVHCASFFVKDYFLRLGFLDGKEGLNVAALKSLGAYFKYAKLLEMQKRAR
ncbi:MAG: glycosyltransferase family 2 protein [Thermodesulfovibrionales bacterium]